MAEAMTQRRAALHEIIQLGDFGEINNNQPGIVVSNRTDLSMVQVAVWEDQFNNALDNIKKITGLRPKTTACHAVRSDDISILWLGPDRWLIVENEKRDLETELTSVVTGEMAAITDQSHSRCVLRITGSQTRNLLRKGTMLDLDEKHFIVDDVRTTSLFHMNAIIHCLNDDSFDLYVARSFGQSFFEVITHAALEYGYRVEE